MKYLNVIESHKQVEMWVKHL